MRIFSLLAAAALVPRCETTHADITETLRKEQRPPKQGHNEINRSSMDITANSSDCLPKFDMSSFTNHSGRSTGRILFQTDIVLTEREAEQICNDFESSARVKRQVLKSFTIQNSTWKDGIFYAFNTSDHLVQKIFKIGTKIWSDNSCIDFVEDKYAQDKLVVVREPGCFSSVGQRGGDQLISIGDSCMTVRSAVHEIGHALGLFHTMSRYDRDNFISIVKQNLHPRDTAEFQMMDVSKADVYGLTYDFGSVMHYDELSGSANNKPTMIAKDPHYQKTMGSGLISFSDLYMINEHHGCNARCKKARSAQCANEGFPHPRNCSICICPSGYGGDHCDRRPPGCGEDLNATRVKQMVFHSLGRGFSLRHHFDFCNYMIKAPEGKKVEVHVQSISNGYDLPGCQLGGVEVKAQKDQKLTGYRFCSVKGSKIPIVSSSNRIPVILFNSADTMHVTFAYRYVD